MGALSAPSCRRTIWGGEIKDAIVATTEQAQYLIPVE
jgi:hypothetical protein